MLLVLRDPPPPPTPTRGQPPIVAANPAEGPELLLVLQADGQLLALAGNLQTNVTFAGLRGASSGQGLFTTVVSGQGQVALLSAGGPLIHLEVSPPYPLVVDPDAFVCAKGNLQQSFVTDVSWRTAVGQGSGEAFSLRWEGSGLVSVQPAER